MNYLAWILGVGAGLAALGVSYQLARGIAAVCEAVYMYTAMRWVVFRDATPEPEPASPAPQPQPPEPRAPGPDRARGAEPGADGDERSATPGPR